MSSRTPAADGRRPSLSARWAMMLRRLPAGFLALLVMAASLFGVAPAASAADRVAGTPHPNTFMGIEKLGSERFICIDNGQSVPTTVDTPLVGVNAPDLAYLFWKYGDTTDDVTATALSYIVKTHTALPHNHKGSTPSLQQKRVKELRADAKAHKGPYRASVQVKSSKDNRTATASNLGVRSSAGNWMSGLTMTATIEGPGVWEGTKSKTLKVKTGDKGLTHKIDRTGSFDAADKIKVNVTVDGLPTSKVSYHKAESKNHQRVVRLKQPVGKVKASDSTTLERVKLTYEITTRAQHDTAGDDGVRSSRDEITVNVTDGQWPAGGKLVVHSTLWSNGKDKPNTQAGVPESAKKVADVETVFTGPGTKTTEDVQIPAGQGRDWFTWTEEVTASGKGPNEIHNWSGKYGVTSETFTDSIAEQPFSPKVETKTGKLDKNGDISDTFRVFLDEGEAWGDYTDIETSKSQPTPVMVTFDLYHSMTDATKDNGPDVPKDATHIGQVKSDALTEPTEDLTAPKINVPEEYRNGSLTWVASISSSDTPADQGRENVREFTSDYGIGTESISNQWTPKVVTQAQSPVIDAGDDMVDTLTVSGLPSDGDSEITAECLAWGPFKEKPKKGSEVAKDAALAGKGTVEVNEDGEVDCNAGKAPEPGFYVFTNETLKSKDDRVAGTEDRKVYADESFTTRWAPNVWTNTQDQKVKLGADGTANVSDVLTMAGGQPNSDVPVTVYLNGPVDKLPDDVKSQPKDGAPAHRDDSKEKKDSNVDNTTSDVDGTFEKGKPFADPTSKNSKEFDSSQVIDQVDVVLHLDENGEATVTSPEFTVDAVNYYWFTYKSDGTGYVNPFGDDNIYKGETVFVAPADKVAPAPEKPTGPSVSTGGSVVDPQDDNSSMVGLAAGGALLVGSAAAAIAGIRRKSVDRK